jgi:hypothetical protein
MKGNRGEIGRAEGMKGNRGEIGRAERVTGNVVTKPLQMSPSSGGNIRSVRDCSDIRENLIKIGKILLAGRISSDKIQKQYGRSLEIVPSCG